MKKRIGAILLAALLLVALLPTCGVADADGEPDESGTGLLQCTKDTGPSILIYVVFFVLIYLVVNTIIARKERQKNANAQEPGPAASQEARGATDYEALAAQAQALIEGVPHQTANLANLSALIYETLPDLNWAGFYLLENDVLVLGPFQGKSACIEIPIDKGVCGAAVRENRSQRIEDVHAFEGHIACDSASRSELHQNDAVIGVLDLDSPTLARFTEDDQIGIERVVLAIEPLLF